MDFWTHEPKFFIQLHGANLKKGKELYESQLSHLGSAMLIQDYDANVEIDTAQITATTPYKFPKGALISGSFVMHYVSKNVGHIDHKFDDIDIYFKSKADAQLFLNLNGANGFGFDFNNPMCAYGHIDGNKFNLIYGVDYTSPGHLISRFDIRACSMAIDPNTNMLYVVKGAIEDATQRTLTFNSVPRGVTVRRLTKYVKKGFEIDGYQSLFFVELLGSTIYSAELELMTKEY